MELKQYLNRIEIAEIKNPSLEFLTELQNRHLLTIPFKLQREEGNDWKIQHQFTLIPRGLSDYNAMCDFQQDAPNSSFRIRNACTITTPNGRITLSDSSLTVTENGKKTKTELSSELEFYSLLEKYFGIELER